jgi:uncharacterized protein
MAFEGSESEPKIERMDDGKLTDIAQWEDRCFALVIDQGDADTVHDVSHLRRVLGLARRIAVAEGSHNHLVLTVAAILHDLVHVPKSSPLRSQASRITADKVAERLSEMGFPLNLISNVQHVIEAHSYSANIPPRTPEARAVQDADRLDALGAIGIVRVFAVTGALGRGLFEPVDPLAQSRDLDDGKWGLDHFQIKLLKLPLTMTTQMGRRIAVERAKYIEDFMRRIDDECLGRL